jgi:hypothetical protein
MLRLRVKKNRFQLLGANSTPRGTIVMLAIDDTVHFYFGKSGVGV